MHFNEYSSISTAFPTGTIWKSKENYEQSIAYHFSFQSFLRSRNLFISKIKNLNYSFILRHTNTHTHAHTNKLYNNFYNTLQKTA